MKKGKKIDFNGIFRDKRWSTFSNWLTLTRLLLAPWAAAAIISQQWLISSIIVFVAGLTDLFDGYCARLSNEQTALGALLDPLADKTFLLCSLTALVKSCALFSIPQWFLLGLFVREAVLIVGSGLLLYHVPDIQIRPSFVGKTNTFIQLFFIFFISAHALFNLQVNMLTNTMVIVISALSFYSLVEYLGIAAINVLNRQNS